jgi:hypothetical protein
MFHFGILVLSLACVCDRSRARKKSSRGRIELKIVVVAVSTTKNGDCQLFIDGGESLFRLSTQTIEPFGIHHGEGTARGQFGVAQRFVSQLAPCSCVRALARKMSWKESSADL